MAADDGTSCQEDWQSGSNGKEKNCGDKTSCYKVPHLNAGCASEGAEQELSTQRSEKPSSMQRLVPNDSAREGAHDTDMAADGEEDGPTRRLSREARIALAVSCFAFFVRFASLAAFVPYVFLWLDGNGFDLRARGVIGAIYSIASFCCPLLLGAVADYSGRRRLVFATCVFVNAGSVMLMVSFPKHVASQALCLALIGLSDTGSLLDAFIIRSLTSLGAGKCAPGCRAFGALSWYRIATAASKVLGVSPAATASETGFSSNMFGFLAVLCTCAPLFGLVQEACGVRALFLMYSPFLALSLPVCLSLPIDRAYSAGSTSPDAVTEGAQAQVPKRPPFATRLRLAVRQPRWLGYMSVFVLVGFQYGLGFTYSFIFLKHDLHASGLLIGLSLTAQAAIEVPLFSVAGRFVRALGTHTAMISCMAAAAIRFSGYVVVSSGWLLLPFEVAHGYVFAVAYTVIAILAEETTDDGLQASMVGLLNSCTQAGRIAAVAGWGLVIERVGMRPAFGIASALFAIAALPLCLQLLVPVDGHSFSFCTGTRAPSFNLAFERSREASMAPANGEAFAMAEVCPKNTPTSHV